VSEAIKTDDDLVRLWLAGRPATTRRAYAVDVGKFMEQVGTNIGRVSYQDVVAFLASMGGAAPTTRARRLSAVKSLFRFAYLAGYVRDDPARLVRTPRVDDALATRLLTDAEVAAVAAEASPGRDRTLVELLYHSGIRISEAVGLRWSDVGRSWIVVYGKGGRTRTVVLTAAVVDLLRELRPAGARDRDPVFVNRSGGAISTRYARAIVSRAGAEALGRSISPHWLRHAHASVAVSRGCPLHVIRDSLGHASVSTTNRYLHARPNEGSALYV
jgi:site-specific recombinase XerD